MEYPPLRPDEAERLAELDRYRVIGWHGEEDFDFLTRMAAHICETPVALVSLVFAERQWFVSHHGGDDTEAPWDTSFCAHAIVEPDEPLIIEDARNDTRFHDNPVVVGEPPVIFYAGVPLVNERGYPLGTLCVVDHIPRRLEPAQVDQLKNLARQCLRLLELRRASLENAALNRELQRRLASDQETNNLNRIGTWTLDLRTQALTWTEEVYRIYGVPLDTPLSLDMALAAYHPEDRLRVSAALDILRADGTAMDVTARLRSQRDGERWIRATGRRLDDQLIGAFQDITELKQQELKFRGIFNSTASFIGFMTPDGTLLEANDTALTMAGLREEDVIGKPFWECYWWQISPATQARLRSNIRRVAAGESLSYEVKVWIAEQTPITILFSLRPIVDDRGQVIFIVPEGRPIQDIVDDRDRSKAVIDGTNAGTWEWNVQTGETVFNARWAHIIGYTLEEIAPVSIATWEQHVHPDDLAESRRRLQRCFDGAEEYYEMEARMRHRQGHWVWVLARGKVLRWTESGDPLLMFGTHQDITARKRAEEALRISEQAFRGSFNNAAIGMALVGPDGEWRHVNDALCHIVGYSEDELMQLTFQDITHPEDLDADLALLQQVAAGTRNSYQMEKRYFHKQGHVVRILLAVSAVRDSDGHIVHYVSQITDISALKKAEAELHKTLAVAQEQNGRLRQFAHIVSHNLRSHSNGLTGLLGVLREEHPEIHQNEIVQMLARSAEHLQQTIVDLTDVVSVELGKHSAVPIPLEPMIRKNVESLTSSLREHGMAVHVDVAENVAVLGVPAFVDSVVLNLLTNAIKYRDPRRVGEITIRGYRQHDRIGLEICDNGLGIDLERNGDRLFQLYATFHRHEDARGVGLFITRGQVEAMKGRIEVDSTVGEGTCFTVWLPSGASSAVANQPLARASRASQRA